MTKLVAQLNPELAKGPGDVFSDLSKLRLGQNFIETAGVKKLLTTVPVRKPSKQDFVRVYPHPDYRTNVAMIELQDDRELYLVLPAVANELPGECYPATIFTAINRQSTLFLWPVKLPTGDSNKMLTWHRSAAQAAEKAMTRWVRVRANMDQQAYEMSEAASTIPDPEWPDLPFSEILRIAFKNHLIADHEHPVIKRLLGMA